MPHVPVPPYLVVRPRLAFWVEAAPVQKWTATRSALRDGCFDNARCYDTAGGLRTVLGVEPELTAGLGCALPWKRVRAGVRLGPRVPAGLADLVSDVGAVLANSPEFTDSLEGDLGVIRHRIAESTSIAEAIEAARRVGAA